MLLVMPLICVINFSGAKARLLLSKEVLLVISVDAKSALSANHTASRKAGFARAERE
jgi:hypothetical protein